MQQTTSASEEQINMFLDKLLAEKGMTGLDQEIYEQLRKDLYSRVEDRLNAAILDSLPKHVWPDFEKLLDQKEQKPIHDFLEKHIPDLQTVIASTLLSFRSVYLHA